MANSSMLKLGPFTGGLNNFSDPTSIKDTELAVCKNFDFDVDGTLISRPPVTQDSVTGPITGQNIDLLGYFRSQTGSVYLIGSTTSAIYYLSSGTWNLITNTYAADCAIQYLDKMWIPAIPGSANPGGSWDPSGGFSAVASMPKGSAIAIFKERLWIAAGKSETVNGSRLYFSGIGDGTAWAGADFLDPNKGDGQKLVDIYALSSNLFLFKENGTYVLQYDSSPSKGVINPVSKTIGVADIRCIAQYENILYIFHGGFLYELINYQFNKTNIRNNITKGAAGSYLTNIWVALVGNRIVVFYYGNYFIFYLFTRTWSQWTFTSPVARFYYTPDSANAGSLASYVSNSNAVGNEHTYTFLDGFQASRSESGVHARIETKIYDLNSPNLFKKLYWWGADVLVNGTVDAYAVPVIYNFTVTWAQMASFTWADVINNTWARPSETDISVHEIVSSIGAIRKFLKFMKSMRFRNAYFILDFTITDWVNPSRIYSITPVVAVKQQVPKTTN
jgi:hypothetical protein